MAVDIVAENSLPSTYSFNDMLPGGPGYGDVSVTGFARRISYNVGETVEFCIDGSPSAIRIFRTGYYSDGKGFREVGSIVNLNTVQPELQTIPNSNGATSATNWTTTATWTIPQSATSGIYLAMIRNAESTNAFYVAFVVRDDAASADIIYKTSDLTWGAAYNHYGTKAAPESGANVYGKNTGVGNIMERSFATSYHRPVITRGTVAQTYWWACELPLIRWLERNGHSVKYISSVDLDKVGRPLLQKGKVFLSSGHDEYWTQPMRDAVEDWRDFDGGKSIFMSGNEVFWRARYEHKANGESIMWCYKDTMPGPMGFARNPGQPLDPVTWTGTWKDTRWPERQPEWLLTGTDFGMNGVYDYDATIISNPYGGHKVWGGSSLVDQQITIRGVLGFEADHYHPTQPVESVRLLASYTRAAPGGLSDANGEIYSIQGNIVWGIIFQRYAGGGATVGFGTCQWSWSLDPQHDRGSNIPTNLDAQQFTYNLLRDLGATGATPSGGVVQRAITPLDEYAVAPGGTPVDPEPVDPNPPVKVTTNWQLADGRTVTPFTMRDGQLIQVG